MRVTIPPTTAAGVQRSPVLVYHGRRKANISIQVFDPVTLYMSDKETDLMACDALGNPLRGAQLIQGIQQFLGWSGEMWVACNQQIQVEVVISPL